MLFIGILGCRGDNFLVDSSAHAYEPGISQYGEQAAIILVYAAITILSERASVFRREIMSNLVECR